MAEKTTFYKGGDQVSMTPEEAITFQGGKTDNPYGGLVSSGWSQTAPSVIPKAQNVVDGSNGIRDDVNDVKNEATENFNALASPYADTKIYNGIEDAFTTATEGSTKYQNDIAALAQTQRQLGIFSDDEQKRIDQAGEAAAAEYVPLINEANEAKRKGMPRATISAGERGGFMSTQMAGSAATPEQMTDEARKKVQELNDMGVQIDFDDPRDAGTFVGAGGELENIKSVYDNNISNMKARQLQAKNAAMAALRTAIQTGKRSDLDFSLKMVEAAKKASEDAIRLGNEKVTAISNYEKMMQARTSYNLDVAGKAAFSSLTGDPEIDQTMIDNYAQQYGLDANLLSGVIDDYTNEEITANLATLKTKYDIAKNIPEGETYKDPDTGMFIVGTKEDEPDIMDVVQTVGNTEYKVRYDWSDPENPKELGRVLLGPRWKGTDGDGTTLNTTTEKDQAVLDTVLYLDGLKKSGNFNDFNYGFALTELATELGIEDPALAVNLQDNVNEKLRALEGGIQTTQETNSGGFWGGLFKGNDKTETTTPPTVKTPRPGGPDQFVKDIETIKSAAGETFKGGGLLGKYLK